MKRQKDIDLARLSGMKTALEIVRAKGVEGLQREIDIRNRTGITMPGTMQALEQNIDDIKAWSIRKAAYLFVAAAHDEFGFGPGRIMRLLNKVAEASTLIQTGEASWWDYSQEIDEQLGITIRETKEGGIKLQVLVDSKKGRAKEDPSGSTRKAVTASGGSRPIKSSLKKGKAVESVTEA